MDSETVTREIIDRTSCSHSSDDAEDDMLENALDEIHNTIRINRQEQATNSSKSNGSSDGGVVPEVSDEQAILNQEESSTSSESGDDVAYVSEEVLNIYPSQVDSVSSTAVPVSPGESSGTKKVARVELRGDFKDSEAQLIANVLCGGDATKLYTGGFDKVSHNQLKMVYAAIGPSLGVDSAIALGRMSMSSEYEYFTMIFVDTNNGKGIYAWNGTGTAWE